MTERSSAACTLLATLKKTKSPSPVGGLRLNSVKNEGVPAPMLAFTPAVLSASTSSAIGAFACRQHVRWSRLEFAARRNQDGARLDICRLDRVDEDGRLDLRVDSVENCLDRQPRADRPGKVGSLHQCSPVMPAIGIEADDDVLCGTERRGVGQRWRQLVRVEEQRHRRHAARRQVREPAWHPRPLLPVWPRLEP